MRPTFTQVLIGAGTALGVLLVGRKAFALYRSYARDNSPAPECVMTKLATLHGGLRDMRNVKYIVIHATDGGDSAAGIASYFAQPRHEVTLPDGSTMMQPGGSTNLIVGEDGCARSVPDDMVPAGAPPINENGLHVEFVGQSKWTRDQWLARLRTLENGRRIIRDWSRKYGIPMALRDASDLKSGLPGITTHASITQAFHKTDHLDPGPGFPLDLVLGERVLLP